MPNTKKMLSINNLKKYFPIAKSSIFQRERFYVKANEDISINILEGETFGLVGESGCGKSTLGRVILQLYDQTAGNTMYYGRTLSELAPRYVEHTLRNAGKYIKLYNNACDKSKRLIEECDKLGDEATFFQLQDKNLAIAEMETCLANVAKILGGFFAADTDAGAEILLRQYRINMQCAKINYRIIDILAKSDILSATLNERLNRGEKVQRLSKKITALNSEKSSLESKLIKLTIQGDKIGKELEALKMKHQDNVDFLHYENMHDDGIDLARLKYNEMRILRKDLQIIFQDPYSSLNPRMTIGQIIEEGLITHNFYKQGSPKMKEHILEIMRKCGLQDYMLHRYPHQFSGGQRQRICIARALAVKPNFVVCDECVSALDVSIQSQIINLLQDLKEKEGLTYLFISHDLSVVRYISDRIGVMYLGNLVEVASSEVMFKDPRHPYTVALLSSIPTTDLHDSKKERIVLAGSIPSPIRPPLGCKFHTRCYMACDKCKRVSPPLVEVEPNHFVACHFLDKKIDDKGNYLFNMPKTERKSSRTLFTDENASR